MAVKGTTQSEQFVIDEAIRLKNLGFDWGQAWTQIKRLPGAYSDGNRPNRDLVEQVYDDPEYTTTATEPPQPLISSRTSNENFPQPNAGQPVPAADFTPAPWPTPPAQQPPTGVEQILIDQGLIPAPPTISYPHNPAPWPGGGTVISTPAVVGTAPPAAVGTAPPAGSTTSTYVPSSDGQGPKPGASLEDTLTAKGIELDLVGADMTMRINITNLIEQGYEIPADLLTKYPPLTKKAPTANELALEGLDAGAIELAQGAQAIALKGQKGELDVDPTVTKQLTEGRERLKGDLIRRFGTGSEFNSAWTQATADYEEMALKLQNELKHGQLTTADALVRGERSANAANIQTMGYQQGMMQGIPANMFAGGSSLFQGAAPMQGERMTRAGWDWQGEQAELGRQWQSRENRKKRRADTWNSAMEGVSSIAGVGMGNMGAGKSFFGS